MIKEAEAISRLKEGNVRYRSGKLQQRVHMRERRLELAKYQDPFAVVLGCSDSRVPPEIIFDQGLGDLFICRVAGNVINDESLGSIEYAIDYLGVHLIVVLGHQCCGAVQAAKEAIAARVKAPGHIQSLITAIKPAVEATAQDDLDATIKANVRWVVDALRLSMPVLKPKVDSNELKIVGANYSLETGLVSFFKDVKGV